jgi:hypothetical protein
VFCASPRCRVRMICKTQRFRCGGARNRIMERTGSKRARPLRDSIRLHGRTAVVLVPTVNEQKLAARHKVHLSPTAQPPLPEPLSTGSLVEPPKATLWKDPSYEPFPSDTVHQIDRSPSSRRRCVVAGRAPCHTAFETRAEEYPAPYRLHAMELALTALAACAVRVDHWRRLLSHA